MTEKMPPCFVWHTVDDQTVPVENSHLFARACKDQGVCMRSTYFHMESMACHLPMNSGRAENAEAHIQKSRCSLLVKKVSENGTITLPKEAEVKSL